MALWIAVFIMCAHVVHAAPCDILAAHGTPCAAAHSMVRVMYANFAGPMYRLQRSGDNASMDIFPGPGGFADSPSHTAFCEANPMPPPPLPPADLPPLNTLVRLEPIAAPGYAFRHCYSQGFVTPAEDSGSDHIFKLVAPLSAGVGAGAVSFESTNYPGQYIAPMVGDAGRPGIVPAPDARAASWVFVAAAGGGFTLSSLGAQSSAFASLAVGGNLSGTCAHSYSPPSASAYLVPTTQGSAWAIVPEPTPNPNPYPPRAACVVSVIYDQTGNKNHLLPATPAINNPAFDNPVNATRHPLNVSGHAVYGAYFESGMGYRAQNTTLVARGNDPETIYMVTSGTHVNAGCCFDYGNSENDCDNPAAFCDGCMEAVYFGTGGGWCGGPGPGAGAGPWVLADLENGLWGCDVPGGANSNLTGLPFKFVTAMVKGNTDSFAIKAGNANNATGLTLMWDGPRPPGYQPMHKTGAIILGVGGDNAKGKGRGDQRRTAVGPWTIPGTSIGTFYEGCLTVGYTSDLADTGVHLDIVNAGYGYS